MDAPSQRGDFMREWGRSSAGWQALLPANGALLAGACTGWPGSLYMAKTEAMSRSYATLRGRNC